MKRVESNPDNIDAESKKPRPRIKTKIALGALVLVSVIFTIAEGGISNAVGKLPKHTVSAEKADAARFAAAHNEEYRASSLARKYELTYIFPFMHAGGVERGRGVLGLVGEIFMQYPAVAPTGTSICLWGTPYDSSRSSVDPAGVVPKEEGTFSVIPNNRQLPSLQFANATGNYGDIRPADTATQKQLEAYNCPIG